MRRSMKRKAFTIIEMTIVIAVIAILATVMIPTIGGMIEKAYVSKDTQFAASLNVQLALWEVDHGDIKNEGDLRDAINEFYGDNYYETQFAPDSGKYGYNYWYDIANNTVVLKSLSELAGTPAVTAEGEAEFSPASLRHGLVDGYYLLDRGGNELTDIINSLETEADPQEFENQLNALYALSTDTESEYSALAAKVLSKLDTVTVITNFGAARSSSINNITAVYVPVSVKVINVQEVYQYTFNETYSVDDGTAPSSAPLATSTVTAIELPSGVIVTAGGMSAIVTSNADNGTYEGTTELLVNTSNVEDLKEMFEAYSTDCVITLPSGAQYIVEGANIFPLPREVQNGSFTDGSGNFYTPPVASDLGVTNVGDVKIVYSDVNPELNADGDYYYSVSDTLYVAYDKGTVQLSLAEGVLSSMINWTVSENAPISVDNSGNVTINACDRLNCTATVTATAKTDENNTDSITIYIVMPNAITWTLDNKEQSAPATNANISLSYTEEKEFGLAYSGVGYNQGGYVTMCDSTIGVSFETSGDLFSISDNTLTLDPSKIAATPTQTLTVKYGSSTVPYIEQTYTITVTDNSASPFTVNFIVDQDGDNEQDDGDVRMGASYLFRVGNSNSFTLDKLFNSDKPGNDITLTIYDASKTTGGVYGAINTSGGFYVTIGGEAINTTKLDSNNWKTKAIKFGGTGVAIIEITTGQGTATLAVEVVNGKNVTSASDWNFADASVVLLNNIDLNTKKSINNHNLYGNGFTIDAPTFNVNEAANNALLTLTNGKIDNVVINGPVYPKAIDSMSDGANGYYVAGVYTAGDSTISNSFISGFKSPVRAKGTSLVIDNTTLSGGVYANLEWNAGILYLNNVTTEQKPMLPTIDSTGSTVMGAGIVGSEGAISANLTITGSLAQYNWLTKADVSYLPSDYRSYFTLLFTSATDFVSTDSNGGKYINAGIVFSEDYTGTISNSQSNYGWVNELLYTVETTSGLTSASMTCPNYSPEAQATYEPVITYNPTQLNVKPEDNKLTYAYYENGVIYAGSQNGTFTLNDALTGFSVIKYSGQVWTVNISAKGGTVSGNAVTFTQSGSVVYTMTDSLFYNANGDIDSNTRQYTYEVPVVVATTSIPDAEISFSTNPAAGVYESHSYSTSPDYYLLMPILSGLTIKDDLNKDGVLETVSISESTCPTGLTITGITGSYSDEGYDYVTYNSVYYCYAKNDADNKGAYEITATYQYTGANNNVISATRKFTFTSSSTIVQNNTSTPCVTPETLVTLADGTQKMIKDIQLGEEIIAWNFYTGEYEIVPVSLIQAHSTGYQDVLKLYFDDGTELKILGEHGIYDANLNTFIFIDKDDADDYVGHNFVKQSSDGFETTKLVGYEVYNEYTTAYTILSYAHYNVMLEGMFTVTPAHIGGNFFNPFEVNADMKYDEVQMQADIEKYGLYTYEDFADYVTYEQFEALQLSHFKVSVGKGLVTYEGLVYLLEAFVNNEDFNVNN